MDVLQQSHIINIVWQYLEPLEILRLTAVLDPRPGHGYFLEQYLEEKCPLPQQSSKIAETKPLGPKRVTGYILFGLDWREKHSDKRDDLFRRVALAWQELSGQEKQNWADKADVRNAHYKAEYIEKYGSKSKPKRTKAKKTNSFQQFVADFRKNHPEVSHREVFTRASRDWSNLSGANRQHYEQQADRLNQQYLTEFTANS